MKKAEIENKMSFHFYCISMSVENLKTRYLNLFSVGMFGSAAQQRRAKFWNKSTSLDIDSVEASVSLTRNSFSPRSGSPISSVGTQTSTFKNVGNS